MRVVLSVQKAMAILKNDSVELKDVGIFTYSLSA
jgi:hypothetical protein